LQELTQPITGYNSLAKAAEASDFPSDSEAVWEDRALQKNITDNFKANMFFEQREQVSWSRPSCTALQCILSDCTCQAAHDHAFSKRRDWQEKNHALLILLPMLCLQLLQPPQMHLTPLDFLGTECLEKLGLVYACLYDCRLKRKPTESTDA